MYEIAGTLDINNSVDRTFISIKEGETLDFYAQATDTENDPITYAWDLDGDGSYETVGQSVQKLFTTAATINGSLRVSDATGSAIHNVSIKVNPPSPVFLEVGGLVSMEAENFLTNSIRGDVANSEWYKSTLLPVFSGDDYITTQDNGTANGAWATAAETTYDIKFQTTGTYYVWLRRYSPDASSNSFHAGVDGVELTGKGDATYGSWGWYSPGTFTVSAAGIKTFQIRRREDGFMADKIVITNSSTYKPSTINSGLGPIESSLVSGVTTNELVPKMTPEYKVYPNPARGLLNIESTKKISNFKLYSTSGSLLLSNIIDANKSKISLNGLSAGVYLYSLEFEDGTVISANKLSVNAN